MAPVSIEIMLTDAASGASFSTVILVTRFSLIIVLMFADARVPATLLLG